MAASSTSGLVCPKCRRPLTDLSCRRCRRTYGETDGIPILLLDPTELDREYRDNYDRIAADDIVNPIVAGRFDLLHRDLIDFVGDTTGLAVLDIGSAYGSYLTVMPARRRVAVDLAVAYLKTFPHDQDILKVVGDAEHLPVDPRGFDVIILADVLEHLLRPEKAVALLRGCGARIVVHVPWQENISVYDNSPYKFVHLRSLDDETMAKLFTGFTETRRRLLSVNDIPFAMFEYV